MPSVISKHMNWHQLSNDNVNEYQDLTPLCRIYTTTLHTWLHIIKWSKNWPQNFQQAFCFCRGWSGADYGIVLGGLHSRFLTGREGGKIINTLYPLWSVVTAILLVTRGLYPHVWKKYRTVELNSVWDADFSGLSTYGLTSIVREMSTPPKL